MRKKWSILLPAIAFVLALPFSVAAALPAEEPTNAYYVNDFASVLNTVTEDTIAENGNALADGGGPEIVLVTVSNTGGTDIADYALSLFNTWKIGDAERDDGLLILFSIDEQDGWVLQGTGLESELPSGEAGNLLADSALDDFTAGDYDAAALNAYRAYVERLGGSWNGEGGTATAGTAAATVSSRYVYDETGRLSDGTISYLQNLGDDTKNESGAYVSVALVDDIGGSDVEDYARDFFDAQGMDGNAVLVMISVEDGCSIYPGEHVEGYVNPHLEDVLYDHMYDPYLDYDFDSVARGAASELSNLLITGRAGDSGGAVVVPPAQQQPQPPQPSNNSSRSGGIGSAIASFFSAIFVIVVIVLLIVLCAVMPRRRYYRRYYGVPFNPFAPRYVRRYGAGGYWGHWGGPRPGYHAVPPPHGYGYRRQPPRGGGPGAPPPGGMGGGSYGGSSGSRPVGGGASKTGGASFKRPTSSGGGASFGSRGSSSSRPSGSSFGGSSRGGSSFGGRSGGGSRGGGSSRGGGGGFRGGKR